MADYTLGLALGYGREKSGRVGQQSRVQRLPVARPARPRTSPPARRVKPLAKTYPISCTQDHWSMEGRPIVREANLEQYRAASGFRQADERRKSRR